MFIKKNETCYDLYAFCLLLSLKLFNKCLIAATTGSLKMRLYVISFVMFVQDLALTSQMFQSVIIFDSCTFNGISLYGKC